MRHLICAIALSLLSAAALAAPGAILFDPPTEGGAPDGYRLYVDGDLIGPVVSGHEMEFPDSGTVRIGVEAFNSEGSSLAEIDVQIVPTAPGPVRNLRIEVQCDGRCSVVITPI